ncbi:AMP-binding protein [Aeromicrobium fastidiosum]|uniref:ATP-dependent acyl-CoA ligase n=1 Tax=Aeromicrobium fastidiosum TaxID=52699 RepID=A0A641AS61_9ACTN|nr:AMP-binding protein [Aeromicrobium fastidiosum]KAA1379901.1 ATP-dependent acyl-CoA ligase [Aeromicrobium fastidiosum]MBP2389407.1 crotonobetaine/carnitine-CoA ligase [Aeromicrobium fastidiosum]
MNSAGPHDAGAVFDQPVGELLRRRAGELSDRPYLTVVGRSFTFAEMDARVDEVAAGLQALGVTKGDRVATISTNRSEAVLIFYAVTRLGAILVSLNPFLKGSFLAFQLGHAAPKVVVSDAQGVAALATVIDEVPSLEVCVALDADDGVELAASRLVPFDDLAGLGTDLDLPDVSATDVALIVYTSGTTGNPKGCALSHGYLQCAAQGFLDALEVGPDDVIYGTMPMYHVGVLCHTILGSLMTGIPATLDAHFSARTFIARAEEIGATVTYGVGAHGASLMALPPSPDDRKHRLRTLMVAPMTPATQEEFHERFGIDPLAEIFGQTECIPVSMTPLSGERDRGGAGLPAPQIDVILLDDDDRPVADGEVGEICFRPRHRFAMFSGYWNNPEATLAATSSLWFHSGDLGRIRPSGQVQFVDRKKDSMRRRGENISSAEVEGAILRHPKVADVAVHGVPSELTEEDVKACIILKPGVEVTPEELFAFFQSSMPYYAVPRYVELFDDLPRSAVGRVTKAVLRARPAVGDTGWDLEAMGFSVDRADRRTVAG